MSERKIKILICSSEVGAGKRGASLGPDAVRISAVMQFYNIFERLPMDEVKVRALNRYSPENKQAKYIKLIADTHQKICKKMAATLAAGYKTLIFTGDHSNAAGFISGFREAHIDKKIGVIWIDAHGDIHSPYTSPTGNMHGMPVAILLGIDNIENQTKRKMKDDVVKNWGRLKKTGKNKITPKLLPEDLVYIGIRDLEEQEWGLVNSLQIKNYKPEDIRKKTIKKVAEETVAHFKDYDAVYVSFDVDSLDPEISKGTGTPVEDGLSIQQAVHLLKTFTNMPNCKALEITEVNPLLDVHNKMATAVVKIMKESLEFVG
ncbi:MAG: arginase [Bacteroidetes bacterium]|nr:arginase [Bacteroidota bacterium]